MTGIRTSNRFEVLCELAQSEQWCWNLMCTTCGHGVFRWALKALANGFDPATEEWPVHWGADVTFTMLEEINGPLPSRDDFSLAEQRAIESAVAGCDLERIARTVRLPDWLGYIGIVLDYTERAERQDLELTRILVPQLLRFVSPQSAADSMLQGLLKEGRPLSWHSLELVEHCYCGPYST